MTISKLVRLVSIITLCTFVLLFIVFYFTGKTSQSHVQELVDKDLQLLIGLKDIYGHASQTLASIRNVLATNDDESKKNAEKYYKELIKTLDNAMKIAPSNMQGDLNKLTKMWQENHVLITEIIKLTEQGKKEEAIKKINHPAASDEEITNSLLREISAKNYIPSSASDIYGKALLREFKIAQGQSVAEEPVPGLNIEILGMGCARCDQLENDVRNVLSEMNIAAGLRHVTDN